MKVTVLAENLIEEKTMQNVQVNDRKWAHGLTADSLPVLQIAFNLGGMLTEFGTEGEVGYLNLAFPDVESRVSFEKQMFAPKQI